MKVLINIWADPAMYLATTFTARILSETGNSVDLIYRTPNAHFDVASDVNFGDKSRLQRVGSGNIGLLENQMQSLDTTH
jgi:hypothetical protein